MKKGISALCCYLSYEVLLVVMHLKSRYAKSDVKNLLVFFLKICSTAQQHMEIYLEITLNLILDPLKPEIIFHSIRMLHSPFRETFSGSLRL